MPHLRFEPIFVLLDQVGTSINYYSYQIVLEIFTYMIFSLVSL